MFGSFYSSRAPSNLKLDSFQRVPRDLNLTSHVTSILACKAEERPIRERQKHYTCTFIAKNQRILDRYTTHFKKLCNIAKFSKMTHNNRFLVKFEISSQNNRFLAEFEILSQNNLFLIKLENLSQNDLFLVGISHIKYESIFLTRLF